VSSEDPLVSITSTGVERLESVEDEDSEDRPIPLPPPPPPPLIEDVE
jgi:hypothetical protein